MSAKYKSPSFLLPNELNTSANTANDTGVNSLYSMNFYSGSSDFIQAALSTSSFTSFTISAWVYADSLGSYNGVASQFRAGSTTTSSWFLETIGSNMAFGIANGNALQYASKSFTTLAWHHIVGVWDGTQIEVYVDGVASGFPKSVSAMNTNTVDLAIGGIWNSAGTTVDNGLWNGKIDEVAIFNRDLDSTEISALYGGTSPNIYPSNLMATNLNPIAYYPLGEQAQNSGKLPDTSTNEWQFPNGVLQDYVMDFDGNDEINLSPVQSLTNEFSISIWVKPDVLNNLQVILGNEVSDWIRLNSAGQITFRINGNNPSSENFNAISGNNLVSNAWQHLLFIRDSSDNIRIYRNGSLFSTNTYNQAAAFSIGKIGARTGVYYSGEMSNLAIWNSDQSTNIDNIYNNGSPQTSYTVSPQNWWKLNTDSVYTPSAPNYTKALKFVASESDYIGTSQINLGLENTISFWAKRNGVNFNGMVFGGPAAANYYTVFLTSANHINYRIGTAANAFQNADIVSTLGANEWFHCALVRNNSGADVLCYINGDLKETLTGITGSANNTIVENIGARSSSLDFNINGLLSNAALFNSALSSSQVSTLFNFGTPETNISFSPQAWWKLDDQNAITDYSGNGHTGTNNGATDTPGGVAVTPSWKIPSALTIPTINTTSALDFISAGNKINLNPKFNFDLTSANTISVWVNLESYSAFNSILTNNGTGGGSTGTYTQLLILTTGSVNNTVAFYTYKQGYSTPTPNSGWRSNDIPASEFLNTWHHVMLVRDGQDVSWYYDGQPWGGGTITTTQTENVDVNSIGQGNASAGLVGEISNLAIWNSDQSVNKDNIYNNGQPQSSYTVTPDHLFTLDNLTTGINDVYSSSVGTATSGVTKVDTNVYVGNIPVNGVSTTLPSTALQQSDLQFDSPYSNYSLSFDGTSTVAISGLQSSFTNLSISFWIKSGVDATNAYVFARGTSQFLIFQNSTNASLKYRVKTDAGTINYDVIGGNILDNNWHHCAMVVDTSNNFIKIYEDGSEVDTTTTVGNIETSTSTAYLASASNGAPFKSGYFDELSMFDSVLTSAQILEIYNNGRPKDLGNFSGTAPINWWRLGENAYFQDTTLVLPNSIIGAPNGEASTNNLEMISADAPGTYANGIGTNLDILDRVGNAPLSTSNSQSYNMIPSDISPYVPAYVGDQIANNFSMSFDAASNTSFNATINALNNATALTFSGWFKKTSGNVVGFESFVSSTDRIILYWWSDNNVYWSVRNGSSSSASLSALTIYNWNHIAGTFDGSTNTIKLYINGSLVNTQTGQPSSTSANLANNFHIGLSAGNTYNTGEIDEVAIFDKALTADQVKFDLYQPSLPAGSNKTADIANNPNLPNPVAWYRMGD